MNFTERLRKNIGSVLSALAFLIWSMLVYGGFGEFDGTGFWQSIWDNLTSIGLNTVGASFMQIIVKQGLQEQALNNGINTENTMAKYNEHKAIRKRLQAKEIYLHYFLFERNEKETMQMKNNFLMNNFFKTETELFNSGKKKLINRYKKLLFSIAPQNIKWTSANTEYDEHGRFIMLWKHRELRARRGIITGFATMLFYSILARELFTHFTWDTFWIKTIMLIGYLFVIATSVIFSAIREYEYGKFNVADNLEEINNIWLEFEGWEVPQEVLIKVHGEKAIRGQNPTEPAGAILTAENAGKENPQETPQNAATGEFGALNGIYDTEQEILIKGGSENEKGETTETAADSGADIQTQPQESEAAETVSPDSVDNAIVFDPADEHIGI